MFEISYKYISSSSTTASRFLLSRTARTAEGNVSSQIIEDRYWAHQHAHYDRVEVQLMQAFLQRIPTFVF